MNEAIEKGYRLRFAEYSQFEFRNTSGSAKDLRAFSLSRSISFVRLESQETCP